MVEDSAAQSVASRLGQATRSVFEHHLDLAVLDSGEPLENRSILAPSSRFSTSAPTGTRVPLKIHTPPILEGSRSTAAH